jgi:hypothetical protein
MSVPPQRYANAEFYLSPGADCDARSDLSDHLLARHDRFDAAFINPHFQLPLNEQRPKRGRQTHVDHGNKSSGARTKSPKVCSLPGIYVAGQHIVRLQRFGQAGSDSSFELDGVHAKRILWFGSVIGRVVALALRALYCV